MFIGPRILDIFSFLGPRWVPALAIISSPVSISFVRSFRRIVARSAAQSWWVWTLKDCAFGKDYIRGAFRRSELVGSGR
jgi:hypothetical protein